MISTTPVADASLAPAITNVAIPAMPACMPVSRVPGRKRGPRPRFTPEQVIAALTNANGVKVDAGRALGCSSSTITNYIKTHHSVRAAQDKLTAIQFLDQQNGSAAPLEQGLPS